MKLQMLIKQLDRFRENGVTHGYLRLGFDGEEKTMGFDVAMEQVEMWIEQRRGGEVGEGEISVKPVLSKCWDGNAK